MNWVRLTASALTIILSLSPAAAETIVIAVEDKDWSPYYTWAEGRPQGPCPEIASGAIRHMGAEVEFARYPWVRVLQSVERKKVDAGLCGTRTDERAAYSYFPEEPLLNYDATLFVRTDSPLLDSDISGLDGKTFGMIKGYTYGGVDDGLESGGMTRIETTNRESLLKLLVLGRVDTLLDSILPVLSDARRLGFDDQVRPILPSLAETPGYLFFSMKPGHDDLSKRFSTALVRFKTTPEYLAIKERYGL
jgi:polar amino acid transport system substrate-binding protein